jgi:hypothetical protein
MSDLKNVEVVLTFESGRRHSVRVRLGENDDLAAAMDDATLALECYLEDHPNGPEPVNG